MFDHPQVLCILLKAASKRNTLKVARNAFENNASSDLYTVCCMVAEL